MQMDDDKLDEILTEIRRQNNWLKFQNHERIQTLLESLDEQEQLVFQHTDGESSLRTVQDKSGYASHRSVRQKMQKWRALGIVFKNSRGKWEHLARMEAFGLEAPTPIEVDNDE